MNKLNPKTKRFISFTINIIVILAIILLLEGKFMIWGFVGYLLVLGGIGLFRLLHGGFFMQNLRVLEMSIWGKPLDKEQWEKGDMKHTKVEMTFRGKKMSLRNIIPTNKMLTNKHMASTFFAFAIMFFVIFVTNRYTMNIIMAIIMLQFSLYFKTADLIRQNYDLLMEMKK